MHHLRLAIELGAKYCVYMKQKHAKDVAEKLSRAVGANTEQEFAIWASLCALPSSGHIWLPKGETTAHWVDGGALVTVTVDPAAPTAVSCRPIISDAWRIAAKFELANNSRDPIDRRPRVVSHWTFQFPGGDDFEVRGETIVRREEPFEPDDAERIAHQIVAGMLGVDLESRLTVNGAPA